MPHRVLTKDQEGGVSWTILQRLISAGSRKMWCGPSLSRKFTVIHDDMNIVTLDGKSVMIEGVPFNPKLINRSNEKAPLSMICSLHKSDTVKLEKGSADEFIRKALAEIFLPMPLFSNDRNDAFNYLLACVKELSQRARYYRLYFKKDDKYWECIEKEENKNGKH